MDVNDQNAIRELVERAKQGDKKAIREFVEVFQEELSKFAYYLTQNREEALDLAQQSFLKAIENLGQLGELDRTKSWLMTICRNIFLDSKRKKREDLMDDEGMMDGAGSFESNMEVSLTVNRVLATLESDDRLILILIDRDGLSYKEVAEILRQSESNVKTLVYRSRQKFIEKWNEFETLQGAGSSTHSKRAKP